MKSLLSILIFITVIIGFISCQRVNYYLSSDAKSYGAFKPGSYWIVQNDSTLLTDSIYASELYPVPDIRYGDGKIWESRESTECHINSASDTNFLIRIDVNSISKQFFALGYIYSLYGKSSFNSNADYYYTKLIRKTKSAWIIENDTRSYIYQQSELTNYDQLVINGFNYENVSRIKTLSNEVTSVPDTGIFYIAKNYGPLKWVILGNDSAAGSWTVIRSHVEIEN
ncbi:MAG: hypothetical protein ABI723_19285 [Bacteroidia bacterium]